MKLKILYRGGVCKKYPPTKLDQDQYLKPDKTSWYYHLVSKIPTMTAHSNLEAPLPMKPRNRLSMTS